MTEEIKQGGDESAPVEQVIVAEEPSVGEVLRAAREAAGLRQEDIAERFKLRVAQVQAVEANEWEKLPGRTFSRGLVRGYARELRLDAEALASRVMPEVKVAETPIVPPSTQNLQPTQASTEAPRRDVGMVILGGVILLVTVLVYFLWPSVDKVEHTQVLPPPSAEAPVTAPVVMTQASATPVPENNQSVQQLTPNVVPLNVPAQPQALAAPVLVQPVATGSPAPIKVIFVGQSWVEVKDKNGNVVFSQTGTAGLEKEVSGQAPFSFHIGNAAGVKVQYKGQAVDLRPFTNNNVSRLKLD